MPKEEMLNVEPHYPKKEIVEMGSDEEKDEENPEDYKQPNVIIPKLC